MTHSKTHHFPEGEPEDGPKVRDAQFMEQRLSGECTVSNLPEHRREQLKQHRRNLQFHRSLPPVDAQVDAPVVGVADAQPQAAARPAIVGESNWVPLGPASTLNGQAGTLPAVSGRVEAIAVSADGQTVYVGSANGGVWRSGDAGNTWRPTMNAFNLQPNALQADSLSVGALVVDPGNANRVFVGTGEGGSALFNNRASASGAGYFGVGPAISEDGGNTWRNETLNQPPADGQVAFFPMAIDPHKNQRVVAPTSNGLYVRQSRNEASFPGANFQPQSYLLAYKPSDGASDYSHWNQTVTDVVQVNNFGPSGPLAGFDTLEPFTLEGNPYFIFYNSTNGNYKISLITGGAIRQEKSSGTWATGLKLMAFQLNGLPHLARYKASDGNTSVVLLNADGSTTDVQTALTWPADWTLLALTIEGSPYFIGYKSADGSFQLRQWMANGVAIIIRTRNAGTWPTGATFTAFELQNTQYFMRYITASGAYTVFRVDPDLSFNVVRNVDVSSLITAGLDLTTVVVDDEPYLLTHKFSNGQTNFFKWNALGVPVYQWAKVLFADRNIMPFPMGFEWNQKQAGAKAATDEATAVVSSQKNAATVFFAAFKDGPVFKSTDSGTTWAQVGDAPGFNGRVALAVQPDNPDILYSFDSQAVVRRLDTTALNNPWKTISGTPAKDDMVGLQGNYDLAIAVLPSDPKIIFLGGSTLLSSGEYSAALYRGKVNVCDGPLSIDSPDGKMTFIGNSVHPDVHSLTFDPSVANGLWVGCDGGAFFSNDANATVNLDTLFASKNAGLNTMTQEGLGQHPKYDAVLFVGSQDNGCQRYLGDPAWTVVRKGDSGGVVVNLGNPSKVVCSYVKNRLFKSTTGGAPNSFGTNVSVPNSSAGNMPGSQVLFYAPFATPPATSAQQDYLIFGAKKPFISKDFGASWESIPNGNDGDNLPSLIRSLVFSATSTIFYVGTLDGQIYRFTKKKLFFSFTKERIDTKGATRPPAAPVTGIVTKIGDDKSIYVCYGGQIAANGWRRVWYYDDATSTWTSKSGPGSGDPEALLNIQHNAIVKSAVANELFVASDLGVYKTTDGGTKWAPMGNGLPESAILDLRFFPENMAWNAPAFLRAATYGRGVYEWILSTNAPFQNGVQLYVRDTILDRGIYPTVDGLTSPVDPSKKVSHRNSPDMKTIQRDAVTGFPQAGNIDFVTFSKDVVDISTATAFKQQKDSRVFVQVHQRGGQVAEGVSVRVLLSTKFSDNPPTTQPTPGTPDPAPSPPVLPGNLRLLITSNTAVPAPVGNAAGWLDLGTRVIPQLLAGQPIVVSADIAAAQLPSTGVYCLVAILNQPSDPFVSVEVNADKLAVADRKVAMKYLIAH